MIFRRVALRATVVACTALLGVVSLASAQMPPATPPGTMGGGPQPTGMPDARMMSGIPMPMADLAVGTVSVRVVRGEISNTLADQPVDLLVNGTKRTAKTDASGRAQFTGLAPGDSLRAVTVVDGERIESQPFSVPASGGVRLMLTASGEGAAAAGGAAPVVGAVTFGGDSRIAIEFDDDSLSVYYLLDIVNNGTAAVAPRQPVTFDLPADAASATLLEGSSPQASVKGRRVTVAGPFKPGRTTAQIAYQLPPAGDARTLTQQFPVAFDAVVVAVQKPGDLRLSSVQLREQREMPANGKTYIMASGPGLPAGRPLTLELTGLPHHDTWPRVLALVIGVAVLLAGAWAALGRPADGTTARRRELENRREQLFADLLGVEQAGRSDAIDAEAQAERRSGLMKELERVYGELDTAGSHPTPAGVDRGTPL